MRKLINKFNYAALAGVVYAQAQNIPIVPPEGFGPLSTITISGMVSTLIKLILVIAALLAFIFLVIGGIKWITSGGDKEGTKGAQSTITAALVGLVIVFAAWAIMNLIQTFFGIQILGKITIPVIQ